MKTSDVELAARLLQREACLAGVLDTPAAMVSIISIRAARSGESSGPGTHREVPRRPCMRWTNVIIRSNAGLYSGYGQPCSRTAGFARRKWRTALNVAVTSAPGCRWSGAA